MSPNSPGVFFGMQPSGDTLNGDKGGISNGPDRRPAKSSFSILRSTTSGLCKADIKFWEWLEIRWPSWSMEKPKVKPETKCSAMKGVYPDKRNYVCLPWLVWEVRFGCDLVTEDLRAWAGVFEALLRTRKRQGSVDETLRIYNTNVCTDKRHIQHPYWI